MQWTKLETQFNLDMDFEAQNALTEKTVADKINLNQNFPKQLEVFIQNRLGKQLSHKAMDDPTLKKEVT